MITVATAVCVLFAGWIDRTESPRVREPMTRYDRVMGFVPAVVVRRVGSLGTDLAADAGVEVCRGLLESDARPIPSARRR